MIKLWNTYKKTINHNCNPSAVETEGTVSYWRNTLFSTTMMFLLPLCLIALIPSLFLITYENKEFITILHFTTIGLMCLIAFAPSVKITMRKLIFSFTVFVFATVLNFFAAPSSGSVLVYFLAACIYSIIIFDNKYAFWWSHIVLFISILFGFAIHFKLSDFSHNVDMSSVNEWTAVSANLVFLCYLSSVLIPKIFNGIENHIQEQIRLKRELEKSKMTLQIKNEELEQFAFVASHDLQEPLRMISSFMDKLKRKYSDQLDDKALQYIHYARDGAQRMKQIILDLLLYSRSNRPTELIEEVNLNELVAEYTQLRRALIAEKKAKITYDSLPVLQTFRVPITQVIHSLLDNALKYIKENVPPHIEIQAREKETVWEFSVKDNGIGIDEKFYDKIFVIFQRLQNRNQHDGNGIGLPIAKRSVEYLGGEIWLKSKVGEGTVFYFTISKNN
ncbi:sensor histidine kinase [Aquiflexum lacus]|uniref:sensor histidine kinase n=1 Tax=Aquiflexum lacus TaxID=2483805 RepID=UPI0037435BC1